MCEIRLAEPENAEEVMRLYRSLVGTKGLTWNENYPLLEDVERDISEKSLYIAVSDGEIVGLRARELTKTPRVCRQSKTLAICIEWV